MREVTLINNIIFIRSIFPLEDPLLRQLILQLILIACNAVFACAEIAVISVSESRIALLVEQGDKRAVRLSKMTSQPARFLATIQVAITLSGFLGSAFAADNFADRFADWFLTVVPSADRSVVNTASVILITLILSYFTLILGELVPKRLAMKNAEKVALGISTMITFVAKLFAPVVWLLTISTNGILRLCGVDPNAQDEEVSEDEIRMMADAGSKKGVIDEEENEMIQNVFEFDNVSVVEFCTHRTDVALLWADDSPEEWEKTIHESRHTLYPVCGDSADDVLGILNVKDYFRLEDKSRASVLANAVRPAHFVPESIKADVLFRQMKSSKNHFAVVLDEYGGMSGIVTMNDLLEQIVGDLGDSESEKSPDVLEKVDDTTWRISGSVSLAAVGIELGVTLPVEEYDTFGGFVFGSYGMVPDDGDVFEVDAAGLHIRVTSIKDHRIEESIVSPLIKFAETEDGDN
jgi:putative hemolysin